VKLSQKKKAGLSDEDLASLMDNRFEQMETTALLKKCKGTKEESNLI
jgi:hypothetical protein